MASEESKFIPKTNVPRSENYVDNLQQKLGILDYDNNFDNIFPKYKLAIRFVGEVKEAIRQEVIPLVTKERMDLYPNIRAMYKLDKLWNGRCHYAVIYDENEVNLIYRKFCFDYPTGKVNGMDITEIIPLPALRNMVPTGKISDPTWGIQIKEPMAMKYATSGVSYATFVHEGGMTWFLQDGAFPKITKDDMHSLAKTTYWISRPVYNDLMKDFDEIFESNYNIFALNVQRIIRWMKDEDVGLELIEEEEEYEMISE